MAKDGTNRGGARVGSGRKPKPLNEKILEGKSQKDLEVLESPDLSTADMPPVEEYMTAVQKDGQQLCAKEIYEKTWKWLKARRCEDLVSPQMIQQYSMAVARWIHCENAISQFGYLAKHPTTGAAIASPYVAMEREYMKQINQCWFQIAQVVKDNCTAEYGSYTPHDDFMESLLSSQGKK